MATRSPLGPEIGNLEAYRRLLRGTGDRVCTMFGSSCGAGRTNLTYLQRDVYPCGRMFRDPGWRLGAFDEALELFPGCMAQRKFQFDQEAGAAADQQEGECLLDRGSRTARSAWIAWLQRQEE